MRVGKEEYADRVVTDTLVCENTSLGSAKIHTFVDKDTNELVFKITDGNENVYYTRLPLNMGSPNERALSLQTTTTPTTFQKLVSISPIKGICYQPSPSDYSSLPPPSQYYDTDFNNSDFSGLWGTTCVPSGGPCTPRNDLGTLKNLGVNLIRSFNLNRQDFRNHIPFLDACAANEISVILPLDYWVIQCNGPFWSTLKPLLISIITTLGPHPAVVAWQLGNELNGNDNADKIASVFQILVQNDVSKKPCTSCLQLGFFPSMATTIKTAITTLGYASNYKNLWFQSVNIYPPINDPVSNATVNLSQVIDTDWPSSEFKDQYFLITEYGLAVDDTNTVQANSVAAQIAWIKNVTNKLFLGACIFEFSNELWKTGPPSQINLGIVDFAGTYASAVEPSNNSIYRVDDLLNKPVYSVFQTY